MSPSEQPNHEQYLSPFAWRYASEAMRRLWGEAHRRRLWRRVWVALAAAQHEAGLVSETQLEDLRRHADAVDLARAHEIEAEIHHDLMAEIRTYAEQARVGGPILHLGATSMDIEDNAEALRQRAALELVLGRTTRLLGHFADQVARWADTPAMGYTHLQPAEPTTVGYRLAQSAQDLITDYEELARVYRRLRGKGIKGAVGTSASYAQLLEGRGLSPRELEARVMAALELEPVEVSTQVAPRKQEWLLLNALAGLAGTLYRFAFDLRLLQMPALGEWHEPFGSAQVGSSAMPFKRNPIRAEKIDSLARYVATLPATAWHNAAHSLLERTLDDSANRRIVIPEAFLAVDELLLVATRLVRELGVNEREIARNLEIYGPFAATERLLMEGVKAGGDRQALHETIRRHALDAWSAIGAGHPNPLGATLAADPELTALLPAARIRELLDAGDYVGDAPERARTLAREAHHARWGTALLLGERLFVARGDRLRARALGSGEREVAEQIRGGRISRLIATPDGEGLILHFDPDPTLSGISNVLRLTRDGAEEWRAELADPARERGYAGITSDGERLLARTPNEITPRALDWESGRLVERA